LKVKSSDGISLLLPENTKVVIWPNIPSYGRIVINSTSYALRRDLGFK
jgi:hypothetical protein